MKLYEWGHDGKKKYKRTLTTAVAAKCEVSSYDVSGSVERAAETAANVAKLLGVLIEKLHTKGVLSDAEVFENFIPYTFKQEEE